MGQIDWTVFMFDLVQLRSNLVRAFAGKFLALFGKDI